MNAVIDLHIPQGSLEEQWDVPGLEESLRGEFGASLPVQQWLDEDDQLHEETLRERIVETLSADYAAKEELVGAERMRFFEKAVMLQLLDGQWKEHLAAMDYLRQGIHLRGYAQKNPKQEYKREAFEMFSRMLDTIKHDVVTTLAKVQVRTEDPMELPEQQRPSEIQFQHEEFKGFGGDEPAPEDAARRGAPEPAQPFVRPERKVGRNEPCPCGSGKKYKHCHGRIE